MTRTRPASAHNVCVVCGVCVCVCGVCVYVVCVWCVCVCV